MHYDSECIAFNTNEDGVFNVDNVSDEVIQQFTSMFTDMFKTYLMLSNQAARQIHLFLNCALYGKESFSVEVLLFNFFSEQAQNTIGKMLKNEEYKGMTVDQSNGQMIIRFENAKLLFELQIAC